MQNDLRFYGVTYYQKIQVKMYFLGLIKLDQISLYCNEKAQHIKAGKVFAANIK
jgi:hypothetical protein